ncbi:bifunctional methylenetetrahydrofolate dehydrogenase/methenyltetrahydrofolate cyclohydrolase FolD [Candidatus Margulisiibacteriota bacterium]
MKNNLIDGKATRDKLLEDLTKEIAKLKKKYNKTPGLAVILVGSDPASQVYVSSKHKACEKIGMNSYEYKLSAETKEAELIDLIQKLNQDENVNGILLQLPLPSHLNEQKLLYLINPEKDVDGFHPVNVGKLLLGLDCFKSCTPAGIMELLEAYDVETEGKHVVIVGRSNIVGKPVAAMLVQKAKNANATVTICHSRTKNIPELAKQADILIAAIGKPEFIKADFVKDGAVVIDVGINRVEDKTRERGYRLVGDVDFTNVAPKCQLITPVPGGVGPMTIASLMKNTVKAFLASL